MHKMRTDDIEVSSFVQRHDYTPSMYLPQDKAQRVVDLPAEILRRGLCAKSAGNVQTCAACPGGCRIGRELVRREEGGTKS
jgi:hypothetical protein